MTIFRSMEGVGTTSSCSSLRKKDTCLTNPTADFYWAKVGLMPVPEPNPSRENGVTLRPFSPSLGLEERSASSEVHGHVGYNRYLSKIRAV